MSKVSVPAEAIDGIIKAQEKLMVDRVQEFFECPKDCVSRYGRSCMLGPDNHCIRRAEDFYQKDEG